MLNHIGSPFYGNGGVPTALALCTLAVLIVFGIGYVVDRMERRRATQRRTPRYRALLHLCAVPAPADQPRGVNHAACV